MNRITQKPPLPAEFSDPEWCLRTERDVDDPTGHRRYRLSLAAGATAAGVRALLALGGLPDAAGHSLDGRPVGWTWGTVLKGVARQDAGAFAEVRALHRRAREGRA